MTDKHMLDEALRYIHYAYGYILMLDKTTQTKEIGDKLTEVEHIIIEMKANA